LSRGPNADHIRVFVNHHQSVGASAASTAAQPGRTSRCPPTVPREGDSPEWPSCVPPACSSMTESRLAWGMTLEIRQVRSSEKSCSPETVPPWERPLRSAHRSGYLVETNVIRL
jgi:hypothetical protein